MLNKKSLLLITSAGLLVCQIIATGHVFLSNRAVLEQTLLLTQAGYLPVPNEIVARGLSDLIPAIAGGLFYTLSLGAGLTVLSFLAAWIWILPFNRSRFALKMIVILHLLLILSVNLKGVTLFPSLYIVTIPLTVFGITSRFARPNFKSQTPPIRFYLLVHAIPILFLSILWGTQMSDRMFLNVRDTLLLSNAFGLKLNTFYYNYTLHAAETFRPIHQKLIKTCRMADFDDPIVEKSVRSQVIRYDYLPVSTEKRVDLEISLNKNNKELLFYHHSRHLLTVSYSRFMADAGDILSQISSGCDKNGGFRFLTIFSLLIGLPLVLYAFLYIMLYGVFRFFLGEIQSMVVVSVAGVTIGSLLFVPVFLLERGGPEIDMIGSYLKSGMPTMRLQALKKINQEGLELTAFDGYSDILSGKRIPELYWAVRALGKSRNDAAYKQLIAFLDSENTNVACMAYHALGKMKDKRAINEIIRRIRVSKNWYRQWYAYHALRNLTWKQTVSP